MSPTTRPPADPVDGGDKREARQTDAMMWTIVGHMASAMAVYGGLGYLLGRWTRHPILLLFGVLFGVAVSLAWTIYSASRQQTRR